MKKHLAIAALCLAPLPGCSPDTFTIRTANGGVAPARILGSLDAVQPGRDHLVLRSDSGLVAIRDVDCTQRILTFYATATQPGQGLRTFVNNAVHPDSIYGGLRLLWTPQGSSLYHGDTLLAHSPDIRMSDATEKFTFLIEGHYLRVDIGCSRLYEGKSYGSATEWCAWQTMPGATVVIHNLNSETVDTFHSLEEPIEF